MSAPEEVFNNLHTLLRNHSSSVGVRFTATSYGTRRRVTFFYAGGAVYVQYYNKEGEFAVNVIWIQGIHFAGYCITEDGTFPIISNTKENGVVLGQTDATSEYNSLILNIEENLGLLAQPHVPQSVVVNNKNVTKKIKKHRLSWWRLVLALIVLGSFLWIITVMRNFSFTLTPAQVQQ